MGSRFLSTSSFLSLGDLLDVKLNLVVATLNGFKPGGVKYSATSNSGTITNTIGINGGSLKTLTGTGSSDFVGNEIQDGNSYTIKQTGIINIADQGLGSDGNLELRVFLFNGFNAPSTTLTAITFSGVFFLTSSTNKKWIMETSITRRGNSILATSKFEYMPNATTTFEGALFGGNSLNLDFTMPIKLDIRAYPTQGTISLTCDTMTITKN